MNLRGGGRFINEMRLSTGFMNGVTSLFVPNISLDHDNNVGGPQKTLNPDVVKML